MISAETRKKYTATIGIECHVQLRTKTKLFSAVSNEAYEASPNTLISHIDLGMPGALPVLNKKAVDYAISIAFAFNTRPQKYSYFERKHYFYPDLPKGYQITQLAKPIIVGGYVTIDVDGKSKDIRLNRVQMEEDAGKSMHPEGKDYSLVDLNRAGTPLLEVVSEADMHSAAEAKAYAKELYLIARYTDVSLADMYKGNIRFDVNVSVSKTDALGTRSETKNLNSFRSVEKAVEYEINRQIELLEKGEKVVQETRGWNDAKQKTFSQRSKEEAHDYRYFPEPDIPPLDLDEAWITLIEKNMPVMPAEWRQRLSGLGLDSQQISTLFDAQEETNADYLSLIEANLEDKERAKTYANWIVNYEIPFRRAIPGGLNDHSSRWPVYDQLYNLQVKNKLSSNSVKALMIELLKLHKVQLPVSIEKYAEEKGYIQVSDEAEIEAIVKEVIQENQTAAQDVKNGEMKAIGFLVGQVMKKSQGKANPELAQELIKKVLR
ncbi:MAG: gatB [Candidatus Saccharibacteria bacterium]|nr:gatB [Candidatus Saccharibacteria bacterium]